MLARASKSWALTLVQKLFWRTQVGCALHTNVHRVCSSSGFSPPDICGSELSLCVRSILFTHLPQWMAKKSRQIGEHVLWRNGDLSLGKEAAT